MIRHVKRPRKSSAQRVTNKWFLLTTKSQEIREMDDTRKIQSEKLGSKNVLFFLSRYYKVGKERKSSTSKETYRGARGAFGSVSNRIKIEHDS